MKIYFEDLDVTVEHEELGPGDDMSEIIHSPRFIDSVSMDLQSQAPCLDEGVFPCVITDNAGEELYKGELCSERVTEFWFNW